MTDARIIPNIDTDTDLRPVVLTEQALHMMRPTKKTICGTRNLRKGYQMVEQRYT